MHLACEVVVRYILPVFRSLVAKELIEKHNLTQIEAAEKLGTTQAAISQYIHSKRGHKAVEQFADILPMLQEAASETAESVASGKGSDEVIVGFCRLCVLLHEKGEMAGKTGRLFPKV